MTGTAIGDDGITRLKHLKSLGTLELDGTKVTEQDIMDHLVRGDTPSMPLGEAG